MTTRLETSTPLQQHAVTLVEQHGSIGRLKDQKILDPDEATRYQAALRRIAHKNGIEGRCWLSRLVGQIGSRWRKPAP